MNNPLKFYSNDVLSAIDDRARDILAFMYPAVTITKGNNEIIVQADLPGFSVKDLSIRVDKSALVIQGTRRVEFEGDMILNQRPESVFKRIPLPYEIGTDTLLKTELQNGVLAVRLSVR